MTPPNRTNWKAVGRSNRVPAHSLARLVLLWLGGMMGALPGCASGELGAVPESECQSGLKWTGGDAESPDMHPGRDCIQCHQERGGPRFTVAGTVYDDLFAADDCAGTDAAEILLTDASGKQVVLQTNLSGNFYYQGQLQFPLTASARRGQDVAQMKDPVPRGACNDCHNGNVDLAMDHPGRLLAP